MKLKRELPLVAIILLPFAYLAYIWNQLPDKVPVHWNIRGEIDRFGEKIELLLIPIFLPLLIYVIFLIIPKMDPKKKLNKMGNKFHTLKFLITTIMSIISLLALYSAKNPSLMNNNYIVLFLGALYVVLGNYMKTIKANYFLGIRTPWTLENETVWKKTHLLGGNMFFIGGLIIIVTSLVLNQTLNFIIFGVVTGVVSIFSILFSFIYYRKEVKTEQL